MGRKIAQPGDNAHARLREPPGGSAPGHYRKSSGPGRLNARRAGGLKTCARPTFYFESRQTEKKAGRASAARTRQSSLCGSRCGIARRLSLCPSLHLASGRVSTEVAVSLSRRASCGGTVSARAGGPASPLTPRLSPALLPGPCATLRTETPAGTEPSIGLWKHVCRVNGGQ